MFYDSLMRYDQSTGEYVPGVAESLDPDTTFATWTLKLRPDVAFGNGDPLDAVAVKASIERYTATATGTYETLAAQIASIDVVDDLTVTFTLSSPWSGFPFTLANTPGMIVNTKVAHAAGDGFAANPTALDHNLSSTVVGTNFGAFADAELDAALADLRVAATEDDILAAMKVVQEGWTAAVPGVVLNAGAVRTVYADDVHGIIPTGNALVFFGAAYVD